MAVRYRSVEVGQVRQRRVGLRHEMHELAALPAAVVGLGWRRADPELDEMQLNRDKRLISQRWKESKHERHRWVHAKREH